MRTADDKAGRDMRARILRALNKFGGAAVRSTDSIARIQQEVAVPDVQNVRYHLKKLEHQGFVWRADCYKKGWAVTESGRLLLEYLDAQKGLDCLYDVWLMDYLGSRGRLAVAAVKKAAFDFDLEYKSKRLGVFYRRPSTENDPHAREDGLVVDRKVTCAEVLEAMKAHHSMPEIAEAFQMSRGTFRDRAIKIFSRAEIRYSSWKELGVKDEEERPSESAELAKAGA